MSEIIQVDYQDQEFQATLEIAGFRLDAYGPTPAAAKLNLLARIEEMQAELKKLS